jgi:hypothetical protein
MIARSGLLDLVRGRVDDVQEHAIEMAGPNSVSRHKAPVNALFSIIYPLEIGFWMLEFELEIPWTRHGVHR